MGNSSPFVIVLLGVGFLATVRPCGALAQDRPSAGARVHLADYEPNAAYPYGRPNPKAPPELTQFDFMVGEFDCEDRSLQPDGSWKEMKTIWNASYFMNGYAILDTHWKEGFTAANFRVFDPDKSKWIITWFKVPPYSFAAGWEGKKEGEKMVVRQDSKGPNGERITMRLTFYDISPDGYEWMAERLVEGELPPWGAFWRISCRRRR
jgi:hypothetical protein